MFANPGAVRCQRWQTDIHVFAAWLSQYGSALCRASRVEFPAAANSKLKAILANLLGGCVAWWKLVPDSERCLRLGSGLGTASGFLLFGLIRIQNETGM